MLPVSKPLSHWALTVLEVLTYHPFEPEDMKMLPLNMALLLTKHSHFVHPACMLLNHKKPRVNPEA